MAKIDNKLWAGRFSGERASVADDFNSSISFDGKMYAQDIEGSLAHAEMLVECGILSEKDGEAIQNGLTAILSDLNSGSLSFDPTAEDIHTFIEAELTKRIGDAGKTSSHRTQSQRSGRARSEAVRPRKNRRNPQKTVHSYISARRQGGRKPQFGYAGVYASSTRSADYVRASPFMLLHDVSARRRTAGRRNATP